MHYAKWEKLDSEGHTLQGSTYETSGGDKTTGQNTDQLLAGAGGGALNDKRAQRNFQDG